MKSQSGQQMPALSEEQKKKIEAFKGVAGQLAQFDAPQMQVVRGGGLIPMIDMPFKQYPIPGSTSDEENGLLSLIAKYINI